MRMWALFFKGYAAGKVLADPKGAVASEGSETRGIVGDSCAYCRSAAFYTLAASKKFKPRHLFVIG